MADALRGDRGSEAPVIAPRAAPSASASYEVRPSRLAGVVALSGAKNSALRMLAASLLTAEPVTLHGFPHTLSDGQLHLGMLEVLGKRWARQDEALVITEPGPPGTDLVWNGRSIRNTLLILGALTARHGAGSVPLPGGCDLGSRPYDLHQLVLTSLGATVTREGATLSAEAPARGLVGNDVHLPIRSTGATENAILCGVLAHGTTRVWNPHIRPEILDLIALLRRMGAAVSVHGQERIEIDGVEQLGGAEHAVILDNMEAMTWLIGAVITGGDVEIQGFPFEHLEVPLVHLRESGARFFRGPDSLIVRGGRPLPVDIATGPYPGINSDMQPLFALYGAFAHGESRVVDLRFPGRYNYAREFARLGVETSIHDNLLKIVGRGAAAVHGGTVRAPDLRAGIALTLAGWGARDGSTLIHDAMQVERGYDRFVEKAHSLGADIRRI